MLLRCIYFLLLTPLILQAKPQTVPDIVGLKASQARDSLERAGLALEINAGDPAPHEDAEFTIQSQEPAAGAKLTDQKKVSARLYGPHEHLVYLKVPKLTGLTRNAAIRRLRKEGFRVGIQEGEPAPEKQRQGRVYQQNPPPGKELHPDEAAVSIIVYRRPKAKKEAIVESPKDDGSFGVFLRAYFPRMPRELPRGVHYRDWVQRLSARNTTWEPSASAIYVKIVGDGAKVYPEAFFKSGKYLSIPIQLSLPVERKGSRVMQGAFLLQVGQVYDNMRLMDAHINERKGQKRVTPILTFDSSSGKFRSIAADQKSIRYEGGPLTEGWPMAMKEHNLKLFNTLLLPAKEGALPEPETIILKIFGPEDEYVR